MTWRTLSVAVVTAALIGGCGADDAPATGADTSVLDASVLDTSVLDAAPPDAVSSPDAAPPDAESSADAAPADAAPPRPTIYVPGPPAETYDCTAEGPPPDRRSPVPLNCPLDPSCHQSMVVAHRGAGGQFGAIAPENSLAGIRAALVMGVDGVELDVRHTADDGLVLMHDHTVDRTTFGTGPVQSMTLAEVTALALRRPVHPDTPGDFDCLRVPTLAQALALTRDRLFVILDTKTDRVDLVVPALIEAGVVDQVFISVSNAARAAAARAIDPAVRVQIRPDAPDEYTEALALFDRPPEIVEIPTGQIAEMAPAIHEGGLTVFSDVFAQDVIDAVRRDGGAYRALYDAGADILQTELPPLVLAALDR